MQFKRNRFENELTAHTKVASTHHTTFLARKSFRLPFRSFVSTLPIDPMTNNPPEPRPDSNLKSSICIQSFKMHPFISASRPTCTTMVILAPRRRVAPKKREKPSNYQRSSPLCEFSWLTCHVITLNLPLRTTVRHVWASSREKRGTGKLET